MLPSVTLNHPNFYILCSFHIFITNEQRDLKFGLSVDNSKSEPAEKKPSLKEA